MLEFVGDARQTGFDLVQQAQDRRWVGGGDHADVGVLGGNPRHRGIAQVVVLDVEDLRRQHVFGANERRGALIDQAGGRAGRRSVGQGLLANGPSEREHTPAEGAEAAMLDIGDRALCPPEAANDARGDRNELRLAGGAAGAGVHRRPLRRDDRLSGRDLPVDVRTHRFVVVNGNEPAKFFAVLMRSIAERAAEFGFLQRQQDRAQRALLRLPRGLGRRHHLSKDGAAHRLHADGEDRFGNGLTERHRTRPGGSGTARAAVRGSAGGSSAPRGRGDRR